MINQAPNIDQRAANEITKQVVRLIRVYAPQWKEFDSVIQQPIGASAALIGIFARFSELIIQRLNEAPQKNFLAFLDLLGAARLPPQPARVPLTFSLAAGSAADGLVLAETQVAAPPAEGEKDPVIFETERDLVVTAAELASLFVRDPEQDRQADRSAILTAAPASGSPMFHGDQPIDHILYIGHSRMLGLSHIVNTTTIVTLDANPANPRQLIWEFWNGVAWQERVPTSSEALNNLMTSGSITFGAVAPIPESSLNQASNRWLRARLLTPITLSSTVRDKMVRASDLPRVRTVQLAVDVQRTVGEGLSPDAAFANAIPIELGKDFFPFSERPKLGNAFFLASAEAFSKDRARGLATRGAIIQLDIQVANSHLLPAANSVWPSRDLQLAWECWNGATWQRVGTSRAPGWLSLVEPDPVPEVTSESSVVITGRAASGGTLRFEATQLQATGATAPVVRVSEDGRFALTIPAALGVNIVNITHSANAGINHMVTFFREGAETKQTVSLIVKLPEQPVDDTRFRLSVQAVGTTASQVTVIRIVGNGFPPISGLKDQELEVPLTAEGRNGFLILGIDASGKALASESVIVARRAGPPAPQPGTGFVDATHAFSQSGIVTLTLPDQVAATAIGGQENFWLRARIITGDYGKEPTYKLKTPTAPEEGFMLILETFHPPVVSAVGIGYQQSLRGEPEVMLSYNNSAFEQIKQRGGAFFEPFRRAPENRPTLYAGFTLPANRRFPNRPISFYAHVEGLKYGEIATPISPDRSKQAGAPETVVRHSFVITNVGPTATFAFKVFGTRWLPAPSAPSAISVPAGESRTVQVLVTVPAGTLPGTTDEGYLQLSDPSGEHTAAFVSLTGGEIVSGEQLRLVWEYWNGRQWSEMTVRDDTENFTRPGLVEFLPPPDFSARTEFGLSARHWLRVSWEKGDYSLEPRLRRILLNTTIAAQTVTIRNESLGSSNGSASQIFRSTKAPILNGQRLEVKEPEMPSAIELETIAREEGEDALIVVPNAPGRPRELWVRWHEVTDFYGSSPRDRHYVLDHLTGEIRTGDGVNGLIPPIGIGNVRLARYQIGGGSAGNKPAGTIVQLKTTVPYVDKVSNAEDAAGGADAETLDSLLERAPRTLRHNRRSVTVEDYEDLAMLASPAVARAKCIPLRNLIDDPLDQRPTVRGEVSVIVVPRSSEAKPVPSLELLSRVQDYLETHSVPTSRVSVVGPLYIRVSVKVEIALVSLEGASMVEQATQEKLASFLHPLTGGHDAEGWDFGRQVHPSDIYALIEGVPGVDHIRFLQIDETEDQPGVRATGRFLVFSGTHTVGLFFESE